MRVFIAFVILGVAGIAGWVVYATTDSQTAAYIVSVAGSAAGLAGLFLASSKSGGRVESKVKVGKARNAKIEGVLYSGDDSIPDVKSELEVDDIEGGGAKGVDWKKKDN